MSTTTATVKQLETKLSNQLKRIDAIDSKLDALVTIENDLSLDDYKAIDKNMKQQEKLISNKDDILEKVAIIKEDLRIARGKETRQLNKKEVTEMKTNTVKNTIELKSLETISNENKASKEVIKLEKTNIETNLKQVCNNILLSAKVYQKEFKGLTKAKAIEKVKKDYDIKKDFDSGVKTVSNAMVTYLLKGLSIDFEQVSSKQFTTIVSFFNKLEQLPTLKNGSINKNYINGLNVVVNKTNLKACKTNTDYKAFIKKVVTFIEENKI